MFADLHIHNVRATVCRKNAEKQATPSGLQPPSVAALWSLRLRGVVKVCTFFFLLPLSLPSSSSFFSLASFANAFFSPGPYARELFVPFARNSASSSFLCRVALLLLLLLLLLLVLLLHDIMTVRLCLVIATVIRWLYDVPLGSYWVELGTAKFNVELSDFQICASYARFALGKLSFANFAN